MQGQPPTESAMKGCGLMPFYVTSGEEKSRGGRPPASPLPTLLAQWSCWRHAKTAVRNSKNPILIGSCYLAVPEAFIHLFYLLPPNTRDLGCCLWEHAVIHFCLMREMLIGGTNDKMTSMLLLYYYFIFFKKTLLSNEDLEIFLSTIQFCAQSKRRSLPFAASQGIAQARGRWCQNA